MAVAAARIIVAGGSLGGLFAANMLLRAGHDVTVLEKSAQQLDGRGAGIVTHAGLVKALAASGVVAGDNLGVRVASRVALDAGGATEASLPHPQVLTSWSRLHALLLAALPAGRLRMGHAVVRVEQSADSVTVHCANGAIVDADLLVACDGIRSALRAQLAPAAEPRYAGYVAWRGVCDEAALGEHTLTTLFDHFGFGLPEGEQMIGYPVAGPGDATARGRRRYNFVWYRPAEGAELRRLMTDADGVHHAGGIAPHKVSASEIARMRTAARSLLAPQWVEVLEQTRQPFLQPIFDLLSEQIAFGRVALLGDAAFVARPHVGMGVTKAGEDALALAAAVAAGGATPAALAGYAAARLPAGRAIVERGRRLGAYLESQGRARPGAAATTRKPIDVLRETAIDLVAAAPPKAVAA